MTTWKQKTIDQTINQLLEGPLPGSREQARQFLFDVVYLTNAEPDWRRLSLVIGRRLLCIDGWQDKLTPRQLVDYLRPRVPYVMAIKVEHSKIFDPQIEFMAGIMISYAERIGLYESFYGAYPPDSKYPVMQELANVV